MFYAKASENELFLKDPHKITYITRDIEVKFDYISYVYNFKTKLMNFKKVLLKSTKPKEHIYLWVCAQYKEREFYFLGGMMCYFILFMHMVKNHQEKNIQIFLDKQGKAKIEIWKIKNYLNRKELYFGKVPLDIFEYTFSEIKNLKPAEFFQSYLEACELLGLYHEELLIFEKPEIELILKHKHEIDKDIK